MRKTIVGVMGPGDGATRKERDLAFELGGLIAREGWVLLTGGRSAGVMAAASEGAHEAGGLTVGVLPSSDHEGCAEFVDIPILTDMGSARNNINVLSSEVVIACGMGPGTASEVCLAIAARRPVVLLGTSEHDASFFRTLGPHLVTVAGGPGDAVQAVRRILTGKI